MELGLRDYTRADLEALRDAGEVLHVKVVGLARIAPDVTPELALQTIGSITVLGALQASPGDQEGARRPHQLSRTTSHKDKNMIEFNAGARRPATDDARADAHARRATISCSARLPSTGCAVRRRARCRLPDAQGLMSLLATGAAYGRRHDRAEARPSAGGHPRRGASSCQARIRAAAAAAPIASMCRPRREAGVTGIVMMLHGCTQTPEDFAIGTGMNALAERTASSWSIPSSRAATMRRSCWNWFSPNDQRRDRGEPAILAGHRPQGDGTITASRRSAPSSPASRRARRWR